MQMNEPIAVRVLEEIRGVQKVYRFANGYGASVVKGEHTYGGSDNLWELAVIKYKSNDSDDLDYELCYKTPITEDVCGHMSDEEVEATINRIRELP